jgi:hypothetical protein
VSKRKEYLLRMSEDLHKELKVLTVVKETTMMDFIVEAIKEKISRENKQV